jgi:ribonucleoside-diphosphate reductase beta chain
MPIEFDSLPLRLFVKGRELAWHPARIDMSKDKEDWQALTDEEREILLQMIIGFLIGERAVAHDLAPLQLALRTEKGRMEEEMYLTAQTFEESVHVTFFQRWLDEVIPDQRHGRVPLPMMDEQGYRLIGIEMPEAMQALNTDKSPKAQLKASIAYHIHVEAISAEVGYKQIYGSCEPRGILPGLIEGIHNVQRDEVRHIAFGLYFCQRLLRDNPELESVFIEEMERLKPITFFTATAFFEPYGDPSPFGIRRSEIVELFDQLYESRSRIVLGGDPVEV